jgi:type I restriction enzyme, S subunit
MSWPMERLGTHAELIRGITYKPDDVAESGDADVIACMRTKNVQAELDQSDIVWLPASILRNQKKRLRETDILVSSANSWNLVGKACWVPTLDYEATAGGFISILRTCSNSLDARYLYHWFTSPEIQARLRSFSNKTTNISNLDHSRIHELCIPLPPLEEQRRIAAILDKGEATKVLFAKRERAFHAVEESLFAALHDGGNRDVAGRTYSFSDVYWLQEGPGVRNWQFTASGVKLLNVGNITIDSRVDLQRTGRHVSEVEAFGRYSHFLVDEGDLLMPSSGIPIDEDGLLRTRSAFASKDDLPLCMNTSTIRFKPKMEGASLLFLQGWLQSREFRSQITKLVTGSAQKNFGPSHLKQLSITLPKASAQAEFGKRQISIRELRNSLSPSAHSLSELLGSIGNLAFNASVAR